MKMNWKNIAKGTLFILLPAIALSGVIGYYAPLPLKPLCPLIGLALGLGAFTVADGIWPWYE